MSGQPPRPAAHTWVTETEGWGSHPSGDGVMGRAGEEQGQETMADRSTNQTEARQGGETGEGPTMSKVEGMEPWGTKVRPHSSEEKPLSSNRLQLCFCFY